LTFRLFFGYYEFVEAEINEKISVVSLFEKGKIKPILFKWQNRLYKILQVAFSYSKNIGKDKFYYFSVQTESGGFELSFNREKFSWNLERIF